MKTNNVLVNNLCSWPLGFRRLAGQGDIAIPGKARNFPLLSEEEVLAQIQTGNVMFTGTDGMGNHARIQIVDEAKRKELFGLGDQVALSTLPKSTTAPIALAVTGELGGTASITMAAVMTTGVMGAIFSPMLANLFHIKNKVAQGVAIGTCSHAVGTAKALEMGKLEGAMSGVAIAVSGLLTCFIVIAATSIM